jgi:hypothetical protein
MTGDRKTLTTMGQESMSAGHPDLPGMGEPEATNG